MRPALVFMAHLKLFEVGATAAAAIPHDTEAHNCEDEAEASGCNADLATEGDGPGVSVVRPDAAWCRRRDVHDGCGEYAAVHGDGRAGGRLLPTSGIQHGEIVAEVVAIIACFQACGALGHLLRVPSCAVVVGTLGSTVIARLYVGLQGLAGTPISDVSFHLWRRDVEVNLRCHTWTIGNVGVARITKQAP